MKTVNKLLVALCLLAASPAWAGFAQTTCRSHDGSVQVIQREGARNSIRDVRINDEPIQSLKYTESIEQEVELESSGSPMGQISREFAVKASYSNANGQVVLSKRLICHFHYGF